jgi:bleomycin hydrolase
MVKDIISNEKIIKFSKEYNSNRNYKIIANALSKNSIQAVTYNNGILTNTQFEFSQEIETLKVTNQKKSGRCWIFAGLNMLREIVAKKLNMENFEFSENYVAFWDKFEKINYFLECIIDTVEEPVNSRIVNWIVQTGIQDGGQWEMFTNIVEKYGVVPKEAMPEIFLSSNTGSMNGLLNTKLRKNASILRKMHVAG